MRRSGYDPLDAVIRRIDELVTERERDPRAWAARERWAAGLRRERELQEREAADRAAAKGTP